MNEGDSYLEEAQWALQNAFPLIRAKAIESVLGHADNSYSKAFRFLHEIESKRSSIKGLGRRKFPGLIPGNVDPFIKQHRKKKRFEVTNEKLCVEIDAIAGDSELQLTTSNNDALSDVRRRLKKLVEEDVRKAFPSVADLHDIRHFADSGMSQFFVALLEMQREFAEKELPSRIDIGFHYTNRKNIPSILRNGLLSKGDLRTGQVVPAKFIGERFGNGVYTANNPIRFSYCGDTCLLVARLQGKTVRLPQYLPSFIREKDLTADTIQGNKISHPVRLDCEGWPTSDYNNEIVLRQSSQCLALIGFRKSLKTDQLGLLCIKYMREKLESMFDVAMNNGLGRAMECNHQELINPLHNTQSWKETIQLDQLSYMAPASLGVDDEPRGSSPSGKMTVMIDNYLMCEGFNANSIVITYDIPAGIQKSYHKEPNVKHRGKFVAAYLPNNIDGQALLKRLKYSFLRGLTFSVGTSEKTGLPNQCTWASIPHKTSRSGGIERYGFPDKEYFAICNNELDTLGVPAANSLDVHGNDVRPTDAVNFDMNRLSLT